MGKRLVVLGAVLILGGCGDENPASPGPAQANVAGFWDVTFVGTIVQRNDGGPVGASQRDSFVLSVQQSGTAVTGEVIHSEGRPSEVRVPLRGTVTGNRFDYAVDASPSGCSLTIRAETTLTGSATAFAGTQTQANCEGRAEGQVIGARR